MQSKSDNPEAREPGWRVVADDGSHEWECDCYGDLSDCPKRFEGSCHARTIPNAEDRRVTALEATNAEQARRIKRLTEALESITKATDAGAYFTARRAAEEALR